MTRPSRNHDDTAVPRLLLALTLVAGIAAASRADEYQPWETIVPELSARIDAIESENEQLRALVMQSNQPRRRDGVTIEFTGRIHIDTWAYPGDSPGVNAFETGDSTITPQDRLELRRARFEAEGNLPGRMYYDLDFELSEASNPEFRDLFIGWRDVPLLQKVQFGNQKRPYGLDHLNSSNFNVMLERPFIVQAFNRNNRRWGLVAYGVSPSERWNWRYGLYNLDELQTDGRYISDHYQLELAGRLARTFQDACDDSVYLHLGVASNYARPDGVPTPGRAPNQARFRTEPEARTNLQWLDTRTIDGAEGYGLLGLESVVNYHRLQVTGEYMNLWLDRRAGFGESVHFHGGYLQVAWFLTDHYQPWNRQLGIISRIQTLPRGSRGNRCFRPAWQAAVRWSFADLSDSDIQGGVGESIAAGLNWYWTPRARFQINCLYGNISDHRPIDGQTFGSYVALGSRVAVDF